MSKIGGCHILSHTLGHLYTKYGLQSVMHNFPTILGWSPKEWNNKIVSTVIYWHKVYLKKILISQEQCLASLCRHISWSNIVSNALTH